nr:hypothetical protein [Tanacetum cinerariifolium]
MLRSSWDGGLDVCVDLTGSSPLTQTGMVDFVPGRVVIDAAQRKRAKYMAKCAAIGYGFLPLSFSSLEELEANAVTLLKISLLKWISLMCEMNMLISLNLWYSYFQAIDLIISVASKRPGSLSKYDRALCPVLPILNDSGNVPGIIPKLYILIPLFCRNVLRTCPPDILYIVSLGRGVYNPMLGLESSLVGTVCFLQVLLDVGVDLCPVEGFHGCAFVPPFLAEGPEKAKGGFRNILDVDFFMKRDPTSSIDEFSWSSICRTFNTSKLFFMTFNTFKLFFMIFKKCEVLKLQALARKDKCTQDNNEYAYASETTHS